MMHYVPTRRLFALAGVLILEGVGCFAWEGFFPVWLLTLLLIIVACATEWFLFGPGQFKMESFSALPHPTAFQPFRLRVVVTSFSPQARKAPLCCAVEAIQSDWLALEAVTAELKPLEAKRFMLEWQVTPLKRGELTWPGAILSFKTPLGLFIQWQALEPISLKVYPRLNRSLQSLLEPKILLEQLGVKAQRFKRSDQVFESLRPYVLGDSYRHIDWKATARSQSLVTRQYQLEEHHNILVCLDTSRLMGTATEGVSKLDWAIEATMQLAYLADYLKDRISLMVFSRGVDRWVKPHQSPVDSFLNEIYNLKCQVVEADIGQVCTQVLAMQKKRSLVIFLSDFLDASSMQPFLPSFASLNRKHCGLFIGIEDPAYKKHLGQLPQTPTALDITRRIVAQDSMEHRQEVLAQLRRMGLRAVTTSPENLVQEAMRGYIDVKMAGAI